MACNKVTDSVFGMVMITVELFSFEICLWHIIENHASSISGAETISSESETALCQRQVLLTLSAITVVKRRSWNHFVCEKHEVTVFVHSP
jgi:hypothetical protein